LDLNNNPLIGDIGVAHIAQHILSMKSPVQLRSLFLSGCGISDVGVNHLLPHLAHPEQSVYILELRKNDITDTGVEMLAQALGKPNVSTPQFTLFLNSNTLIGEDGVVSLAKAVIESQGRLKVNLKDSVPNMSIEDKSEIMKLTKNKIRF
jgi:Ran GTPase-activating protein (RanGAP) involved in mRNA processing and transport